MMIGNVSDAYNDYKIYPYALGNDRKRFCRFFQRRMPDL